MIGVLIVLGIIAVTFGKISDSEAAIRKKLKSRKTWDVWDHDFKMAGIKYGIPWQWIKAVCGNESDFGEAKSVKHGLMAPWDIEGSKSSDGKSWGLMQVTIKTARLDLDAGATEIKLNNAQYSIDLGAKYISMMHKQFPNSLEFTIKSYNQGPGNSRKEMATGKGHTLEYWPRFQKNLARVEALT